MIPQLVRICIKGALEPRVVSREIEGLGIRLDSELGVGIVKILGEVSSTILLKKGSSLYCRLCHGGPYTRRGAYLHLLRIHSRDIEDIVREEIERIISQL